MLRFDSLVFKFSFLTLKFLYLNSDDGEIIPCLCETGSNVVVVQRTSVRAAPDWGPAGGVSRPARSLNHALVCNSLQRATYRSAVLCIAPRRFTLLCSAGECTNCETAAVRPHGEPLRLKTWPGAATVTVATVYRLKKKKKGGWSFDSSENWDKARPSSAPLLLSDIDLLRQGRIFLDY